MFPRMISLSTGVLLSACTITAVSANVLTELINSKLYPAAYIDAPFLAGVKGTVLTTHFRALTTKGYTFYLDLYFRQSDKQDRERVRRIAGTGAYDRAGPWARQIDTGLPIPLRLSVERVGTTANSTFVIDGVFAKHELESGGVDHYSKIIRGAVFDPGDYKITVDALEDVPELANTTVHFNMHAQPVLR